MQEHNNQDTILDALTSYWTDRAKSYSVQNIAEMNDWRREAWRKLILSHAPQKEVLRVLLYQDSKAVPMISLLEKSLGDRTAVLLGERAAADTLILTPRTVSGREMLDAVCMPVGTDPEDVLVLAGGLPMLDMVRASSQSTAAADAPAELRLAAQKVTLTDAAAGSAVEVLYRMVRDAENLA